MCGALDRHRPPAVGDGDPGPDQIGEEWDAGRQVDDGRSGVGAGREEAFGHLAVLDLDGPAPGRRRGGERVRDRRRAAEVPHECRHDEQGGGNASWDEGGLQPVHGAPYARRRPGGNPLDQVGRPYPVM